MNLYKKRKIKSIYGVLIAFSCILIVFSYFGIFKVFPVFEIFTTTIEENTKGLKEGVGVFFSRFDDNQKLSQENLELRKKNTLLDSKIGKINDLQNQIDSLQKFNNVTTLKRSSVMANSMSVVLSDKVPVQITIDKGQKNGIKSGQIVVNDTGSLIGLIDSVSQYTSTVKPYYVFEDIKFPIKSSSTQTALVQGTDNGQVLGLNLGQNDLQVGEAFYTSSLGDKMPEGIYIGKISKLSQDDKKTFYLDTDILNNNILYIYQ